MNLDKSSLIGKMMVFKIIVKGSSPFFVVRGYGGIGRHARFRFL